MGKWFPKTFLRWREPPVVTAWRIDRELRAWPLRLRMLWGLLVVVVITAPAWAPSPVHPPIQTVPVAFAVGLLLLFVPWLLRYSPVVVQITDHGIGLRPYKDISKCSLEPLEIGTKQVWTLKLESPRGPSSVIGVADEVSLRQLQEVLERQGLEVLYFPSSGTSQMLR